MRWLITLAVLGALGYGGYYAYCTYEVKEKRYQFTQASLDLHQSLLRLDRNIGPDDIRAVVRGFAERSRVLLDAAQITPIIEPMTPETMRRLPGAAQMALQIASQFKNHNAPPLIVGFRARFTATHGVASESFEEERYTWWRNQ